MHLNVSTAPSKFIHMYFFLTHMDREAGSGHLDSKETGPISGPLLQPTNQPYNPNSPKLRQQHRPLQKP